MHLALHSFTPHWHGQDRGIDLGLLYDPARQRERQSAASWLAELHRLAPTLRLRRNAPYRGAADGLPTALRRIYNGTNYAGFELEVSQALTCAPAKIWRPICQNLAQILAEWLGKNF